jgi:hypothetical protein
MPPSKTTAATQSAGAALDREYQDALKSLKARFEGKHKAVETFFEELYGSDSFLRREFFRKRFREPTVVTTVTEKLAIVSAARRISSVSIPNLILPLIDKSSPEQTHTTDHDGFYRYWRHYPSDNCTNPVRWGVIKLETDESQGTTVKHWSFDYMTRELGLDHQHATVDWTKFAQPEDQGYAFFVRKRMFALSFRDLNVRSLISGEPGGTRYRTKEIVNGIMLTSRSTSGALFSAGFVMVHQDHEWANKPLPLRTFELHVKMKVEDAKKMLFE